MTRTFRIAALAALTVASVAAAQDAPPSPEEQAVRARQSHMSLYAFNLGKLGAMAQGNVEYDGAAATTAAQNLSHMTQLDQAGYWLPGTSNAEFDDSEALPAIWENMDDFSAKHEALEQAVTNLQAGAGTDLATLQASLGEVGKACGACHQDYREADE